jgi:hypothetical protein
MKTINPRYFKKLNMNKDTAINNLFVRIYSSKPGAFDG